MNSVDLSAAGDVEDLVDVEVSLGRSDAVESEGLIGEFDEQPLRVGVCVDGHAGDADVLGGTDDAYRDLTAVRDEYPLDGPIHSSSDRLLGTGRPHGESKGLTYVAWSLSISSSPRHRVATLMWEPWKISFWLHGWQWGSC